MYKNMVIVLLGIISVCNIHAESSQKDSSKKAEAEKRKVVVKRQPKKQDGAKSYIVARSEENSVAVLDFQVFDPPIYTVGDKIVGDLYDEKDFPWWDTQAAVYRFDKLSYEQLLSLFTESYQKLVPREEYLEGVKNIEEIKKAKETIRYAFICSYKDNKFLFLGSGAGHLKEPSLKNWGVSVFKYVDEQWKWYAASPKDYDSSNLIFLLPLTNIERLTKLIKAQVWQSPRFKSAFKNDLKNINKVK